MFERIHEVGVPETLIGRQNECEICLPDLAVSREHAVLLKTEFGCRIRDLGSRNGTLLDQRLIECEVGLGDGSTVRIGPYQLDVCFSIAAAVRAAADADGSTRSNIAPIVRHDTIESNAPLLTPAQRRVCVLLFEGLIEKEVASRLGITINTVHDHVKAIYRALSVSTRGELISRWSSYFAQSQ